MRSRSIVSRAAVLVSVGSLLIGASSAFAADATPQEADTTAVVDMRPAPASATNALADEARPHGMDAQSIRRHLADSLATSSGLLPRNNSRYSANGNVQMYVQVARPAIGNPFGRERTQIEFPKSGTVQGFLYDLLTN
jgi:hypothetical protein